MFLCSLVFVLLSWNLMVAMAVQPNCGQTETSTNEGTNDLCCYYDTKAIPTIGIGFNLKRTDASEVMAKYGLKLKEVLADCDLPKEKRMHCLKSSQAFEIFNGKNYPEAETCVKNWVGANHPPLVTAALIDMAFMGCGTLSKFVGLRSAVVANDYLAAAREATNSQWCRQVGTRCDRDRACFLAGWCKKNLHSCSGNQGMAHACCEIAAPAYKERCCPPSTVCVPDACCPQDFPIGCSPNCCKTGSVCIGNGHCCPQGQTQLCGEYCCEPGSDCCSDGRCCPPRSVCVGNGKCCPRDQPQACGEHCCPQGAQCCGGGLGCCASGSVCCSSGCCPSGYHCCGDKCCRTALQASDDVMPITTSVIPILQDTVSSRQTEQGLLHSNDWKTSVVSFEEKQEYAARLNHEEL